MPKQPPKKDQEKPIPKQNPPDQKPVQPAPKKKSPPKKKEDETLKYTMTYANGGFNNGVEIKPGKDGNIELSITIYGGGENKTLTISKLPSTIDKLIRGYEIGATTNQDTSELTDGLKDYFNRINQILSMRVIEILQQTDEQIKMAIKKTFNDVK